MYRRNSLPRLTYLVLAICLLVSLVLVACSGSTPSTSQATTSTTTQVTSSTTTSTVPTQAGTSTSTASTKPSTTTQATPTTITPKTGGILRIGTGIDAVNLGNPPGQTTVQDTVTSKTCVEPLARYDAQGNMVPWLAESWKIDAQAKTITIALKKGILFHDGTPFNAQAAKWNLDHFIAAKRSELPVGSTTDVIDDYTVRLNLPVWNNTAIVGMGYFAGPMISPTAWQNSAATDKDRDAWAVLNPVGTGPYQFVSWQKTVKQVYKKNPNYWQKGLPYLDGIEWNFFADVTVMEAAYLNKEIDVIYLLSPISAKNLKAQNANIVSLSSGLGLQMLSVWYNSAIANSPFTNLQVRQAINYAIDPKAIVDTLYYGYATAVNQWAMPTSQWANPDYKGYAYDPAKAKQLLTDAGFSGLQTKMLTLNTPDTVAVGTAVQGMLAKAGITVDLDVADNARYRQLTSPGGSFEAMCLGSQRASELDPALLFPRNLSEGGNIMNKTIIHPPEVEQAMVDAKAAPDQAAKVAIIRNLQKTIFGDYAIFTPLFVPSGISAKQAYVKDDGLMTVEYTQWTPETAWLNK